MREVPEFRTTKLARERARRARDGALTLQVCDECGLVQYPSRSVCTACLSPALSWSEVPSAGRVLATAVVHASLHPGFRQQGPWSICSVRLDAGPRVVAYTSEGGVRPGDLVHVHDRRVGDEQRVLIAHRAETRDNRSEP